MNEQQKLLHKYKKEKKGAIREIRKDTIMLAQVQHREQKEKYILNINELIITKIGL